METPSKSRFERPVRDWVIIGAIALLNIWYDYYHPVGFVLGGILVVILFVKKFTS